VDLVILQDEFLEVWALVIVHLLVVVKQYLDVAVLYLPIKLNSQLLPDEIIYICNFLLNVHLLLPKTLDSLSCVRILLQYLNPYLNVLLMDVLPYFIFSLG
jgi:hypothetical protein